MHFFVAVIQPHTDGQDEKQDHDEKHEREDPAEQGENTQNDPQEDVQRGHHISSLLSPKVSVMCSGFGFFRYSFRLAHLL